MTERYELRRTYTFEAAHHLPAAPPDHRCRRMHGHSYSFEVTVGGQVTEAGWVMDFGEIDAVVKPIRDRLDHQLLNEVPGLENPTSELLARWFWNHLVQKLPGLAAVMVRETPSSAATYRGSGE